MRTMVIPRTNLKVSQICLGTVNFGVPLSQVESFRLMDEFVDKGGNFLDTARVYAEWLRGGANASENTIGTWMQRRGNRDKLIIATKGGHPPLSTMNQSRLNPKAVREDIEASLKFLQTDVIDLYWLHRDDSSQPAGSILEMMNEQIRLGNIRFVACSNWTVERIRSASTYAAQHQLNDFIANQFMWSLAEPNREAIPDKTIVIASDAEPTYHRETQLPAMPYTSQAKGFFSKLATGQPQKANNLVYDNALNRRRFSRIQELSKHYKVSIAAIVLGYLTSQPFPVFPIISASTLEQLNDSLSSTELTLSPEELTFLDALE